MKLIGDLRNRRCLYWLTFSQRGSINVSKSLELALLFWTWAPKACSFMIEPAFIDALMATSNSLAIVSWSGRPDPDDRVSSALVAIRLGVFGRSFGATKQVTHSAPVTHKRIKMNLILPEFIPKAILDTATKFSSFNFLLRQLRQSDTRYRTVPTECRYQVYSTSTYRSQ